MSARERKTYVVLGFASTHDALDAESALEGQGFSVVTIPAPKAIGSLCGIALRLPPQEAELARERLMMAGITVAASCAFEDV